MPGISDPTAYLTATTGRGQSIEVADCASRAACSIADTSDPLESII